MMVVSDMHYGKVQLEGRHSVRSDGAATTRGRLMVPAPLGQLPYVGREAHSM